MKTGKDFDVNKAISTTDYKHLYCIRKEGKMGQVLSGYEKSHKICVEFFKCKTVERYLVYLGDKTYENDEVNFINSRSVPNFFDSLEVGNVWGYLKKNDI
jgi:hypothetical protein